MEPANEPLLLAKTYSVPEAARLARTSGWNVRHWLYGQDYPGHSMQPVFGTERDPGERLSFVDLTEIIVVSTFRRKSGRGIPLDRFRRARSFAQQMFGIEHLFATYKFKIDGGNIMYAFERAEPGVGQLALDRGGQLALPYDVQDVLETFDYTGGAYATAWYPRGKDVPIVLNPLLGAGRPVIAGSNVRLEVLKSRWKAGWKIQELAEDFEIDRETVEAALQEAA